MVDRIYSESLRLGCPDFADVFVRGETLQGLEALAELVSIYEVNKMGFELLVAVVVLAFDGGVLDRSFDAFDLAIYPGMFDLGQPVFEIGASYLADQIHPNHSPTPFPASQGQRKGTLPHHQ